MAFKSVEEFNNERYHGLFRLINDEDSAEVIFLYRRKEDALQVTAHYIKSADYSGYVHCTGKGCPVCAKGGIRVQSKLFIPLYVISQNGEKVDKILFWDRNMTFYPQIERDVFNRFPGDPSNVVFKIVRHGVSNDRETTFEITGKYRNSALTYDQILAKFNAKMPDYYSEVIREYTPAELSALLQSASNVAVKDMPEFTPIPRAGYQSSIPDTFVDASEAVSGVPDLPDAAELLDTDVEELTEVGGDDELPDPNF